jgi:hypothetical protein
VPATASVPASTDDQESNTAEVEGGSAAQQIKVSDIKRRTHGTEQDALLDGESDFHPLLFSGKKNPKTGCGPCGPPKTNPNYWESFPVAAGTTVSDISKQYNGALVATGPPWAVGHILKDDFLLEAGKWYQLLPGSITWDEKTLGPFAVATLGTFVLGFVKSSTRPSSLTNVNSCVPNRTIQTCIETDENSRPNRRG